MNDSMKRRCNARQKPPGLRAITSEYVCILACYWDCTSVYEETIGDGSRLGLFEASQYVLNLRTVNTHVL